MAIELSKGLPDHPNHVAELPFLYKEVPFRRFVSRLIEEFSEAGYDDVIAFMQGSTASGYKHDGIKLDARNGVLPSDYDVAIVSMKLLAKAESLSLNALQGPLAPELIVTLGLQDAQNSLSAASKAALPVNFKVYKTVSEVYEFGPTIPFGLFQE